MKFKVNPLQSHLIIPWLINMGVAVFFAINGEHLLSLLTGIPAFLMMLYIFLESKLAGYVFEEENLVWKNVFGRREIVPYESIKKVHKTRVLLGSRAGWARLSLDIGRRIGYSVNVKNPKAFVDELKKHIPDLRLVDREL